MLAFAKIYIDGVPHELKTDNHLCESNCDATYCEVSFSSKSQKSKFLKAWRSLQINWINGTTPPFVVIDGWRGEIVHNESIYHKGGIEPTKIAFRLNFMLQLTRHYPTRSVFE